MMYIRKISSFSNIQQSGKPKSLIYKFSFKKYYYIIISCIIKYILHRGGEVNEQRQMEAVCALQGDKITLERYQTVIVSPEGPITERTWFSIFSEFPAAR